MDSETKLELLTSTHITTSGVTFESIKNLQKRYSPLFNRMTIGFECEVAVGESGIGAEDELDLDTLRENFHENFEYTDTEFLSAITSNYKLDELIETFDIKPVYGYPDDSFVVELAKTYKDIKDLGFRVMGLKMQDGSVLMEEVDSSNTADSTLQFVHQDTRMFNVDYVIKIAKENLAIMQKFRINFLGNLASVGNGHHLNSLIASIGNLTSYITTLDLARNDEKEAKKEIYYCFKAIDAFKHYCIMFHKVLKRTSDSSNTQLAVLDDTGKIIIINLLRKRASQNGWDSPFITYNQDEWNEYYEIEENNERERQWDDEVASAQSGSNTDSVNQNVIRNIHEFVLDDVDDDAKLVETYHGDGGGYKGKFTVVEPDSSIKPYGAEIVSPVFTKIDEGFTWLNDVFTMIDTRELETNGSTGLHVNIGTFKTYSTSGNVDSGNLGVRPHIDAVKLAVLSGDHYLLEQFGRFDNEFARSLSREIQELADLDFDPKKISQGLYDTLRSLNIAFLRKISSRYRTINIANLQDKGYIEFRIPGGSNYHEDLNKVKKAIYRYLQLCAIACDQKAYFKEYMGELYKIIVGKSIPYSPPAISKEPRPKNVNEAIYILRAWNSKYHLGREISLLALSKTITSGQVASVESEIIQNLEVVLDNIAMLNMNQYQFVDYNVLYSIRLILLELCKSQPNPRQYLRDLYVSHLDKIKTVMAPKLYKNKPKWIKFFFTGTLSDTNKIESSLMKASAKLALLADTHIEGTTLLWYKNRSTPQVLKKGQKAKPKAGYGPVVKRRRATKDEEAQLKKGKWIRTRSDGKKPGDKGAKRSSYRPKLAALQKTRASSDTETTYNVKTIDPDGNFLSILESLKKLGDEGASRSLTIEDFDDNGTKQLSWDGDGSDKILDIETFKPEFIESDDKSATDDYSYDLNLKIREFNNYGTFETMLENLKAQTDDGLLTTVTVTNANGFIGKFQFGGQKKDEIASQGIDTILDIEKVDNPKAAYYKPNK